VLEFDFGMGMTIRTPGGRKLLSSQNIVKDVEKRV